MIICDRCGSANQRGSNDVGPVELEYNGEGPTYWHADLCPACAKVLKDRLTHCFNFFKEEMKESKS